MGTVHIDKLHTATEAARAEAERLRLVAEETREVWEDRRQAAEARRETGERLRHAADTARTAAEERRAAAETIRQEAMIAVRTTAESLALVLQRMESLEQLRRALRDKPEPLIPETN